MNLSDYVVGVLLKCPSIDTDKYQIRIDHLEANTQALSVNAEPVTPIIRRYLYGDTLRVYSFALLANRYTESETARLETQTMFEGVMRWLEGLGRGLDPIDEYRTPTKFEVTGTPYMVKPLDNQTNTVYALGLSMQYRQKERK